MIFNEASLRSRKIEPHKLEKTTFMFVSTQKSYLYTTTFLSVNYKLVCRVLFVGRINVPMQFHPHAVHVEHYMRTVTSLLNAAGSQQLVLLWVFCSVFFYN